MVRAGRFVAWALSAALAAGLSHADQTATIRNRAFVGSTGAGTDLEVRIVSVDAIPIAQETPHIEIDAGARAVEVLCSTRVFAGMGRTDLSYKTTVTVELEAGRLYQLDAQVTQRGECTPEFKLQ
jgi:hypothetical protein